MYVNSTEMLRSVRSARAAQHIVLDAMRRRRRQSLFHLLFLHLFLLHRNLLHGTLLHRHRLCLLRFRHCHLDHMLRMPTRRGPFRFTNRVMPYVQAQCVTPLRMLALTTKLAY